MPVVVYEDNEGKEHKIKIRKMFPREFWTLQGIDQNNIQSMENYTVIAKAIQKVVLTENVDVEKLPADAFFDILHKSAGGALAISKKLSEM